MIIQSELKKRCIIAFFCTHFQWIYIRKIKLSLKYKHNGNVSVCFHSSSVRPCSNTLSNEYTFQHKILLIWWCYLPLSLPSTSGSRLKYVKYLSDRESKLMHTICKLTGAYLELCSRKKLRNIIDIVNSIKNAFFVCESIHHS